MKCKCLPYNKNYSNKIDEELKKRCKNTCKFSNNDINKFILLLRKGVYHYEYVNECEKFNETSLPEKKKRESQIRKILHMQITCIQKEFVKTFE